MESLGTEKRGETAHILGAVPHISSAAERSSLSSHGIAAGTHQPPKPSEAQSVGTSVAATMCLFKMCKAEHASANLT